MKVLLYDAVHYSNNRRRRRRRLVVFRVWTVAVASSLVCHDHMKNNTTQTHSEQ